MRFSVLGLTMVESLLKNGALDDAQTSRHLLSEEESCWKQQVENWKVYLQIWNLL